MIRHGVITSNINKIYAGRSSEKLTARGEFQAKAIADTLTTYDVAAMYSSPIQRALQTAEIINRKMGIPFFVEDAFQELKMGHWEGLSEDSIASSFPDE